MSLRERFDTHRSRIGVRAGKFKPEFNARHLRHSRIDLQLETIIRIR